VDIELAFRRPLRPDNLFGHLAATMVPAVEEVSDGRYRRTLRLPGGPGIAELAPRPDHIACRLILSRPADCAAAVARCRWLLDLDADPVAIDGHLQSDPVLGELVRAAPGRRVPRCVDGAEMAIRAVLGQQISTAAARTHAGRLAAAHGEPVTDPGGGLTRLFPTPAALREAELAMPASRIRTLRALAAALDKGRLSLEPEADRAAALAVLDELPGIGPWTREVIAMRALGDGDAFPAGDLGVRHGAAALGLPSTRRELTEHSLRWRPWRAYAVQHLWALTPHPINLWPSPADGPSSG
jgi:AraC family transcriptional regulator of adaptative response / DNA-3-methyladenine glycosylase II